MKPKYITPEEQETINNIDFLENHIAHLSLKLNAKNLHPDMVPIIHKEITYRTKQLKKLKEYN